jgi:hypothetical protein
MRSSHSHVSVGTLEDAGGGLESAYKPKFVAVKARVPSAAGELVFADWPQSVGIGSCHSTVDHFIHDLGIAGRVQRVHQILGRRSAHRLRHAVAVAVVDHCDACATGRVLYEYVQARPRTHAT